jgi:hypothetical protein
LPLQLSPLHPFDVPASKRDQDFDVQEMPLALALDICSNVAASAGAV